MIARLPFKPTIFIAGLIILATTIITSLISHQFVYGSGHFERPIVEFFLISLFGFAAYYLAFEKLRSQPRNGREDDRVFIWIIFVSILCRLLYFPSQFIQETDPYRYVWDGQTVLKGGNPYLFSPQEAEELRKEPAKSMPYKGQVFYERINHPSIKTIYPPLAQYIYYFSQVITPWSFSGLRLLIITAEIFTLFLLISILKLTGRPIEWVMLYGWSPLVLKEFSNSLHVDVFAVLFLSTALFAHFKNKIIWAFVLLACATLVKMFAWFLLIPYLIYAWRLNRRAAVKGLLIYGGLIVIFYTPFMNAGPALFEGLSRFALDWRVNEGLFGLIRWVSRGLISFDLPLANQVARIFAMGVVISIMLGASLWAKREATALALAQAWLVVLSALFFLSPAANPWYFTWLLPLLLITPVRSLVLLSGLLFIYYLDLYFAYRGSAHMFDWFRTVEYGLFFCVLGWELWPKINQSRLFYRFQTNAA